MKNEKRLCKAIGKTRTLPTIAGRRMGVVILVSVQSLIGAVHLIFGLWLLSISMMEHIYSIYTVFFGLATLLFALGLWTRKGWGWFGTVLTFTFVVIADALTLLNLPSIPGIPKFATVIEIVYSVIILLYLYRLRVNF
ncbi:MAG: hypothetical protein NWE84_05115 [Candidatus Bathyarchaeota archaeon]|nr:hypothetical protein [Candidatus Bathyarchaeota archaeon]